MNCPRDWPEPIVRVQSLSDSGLTEIPHRYVKPPYSRPAVDPSPPTSHDASINIPLIDLNGLYDDDLRESTLRHVADACRDWGFFQVSNHGVRPELMDRARETWREFFRQPMDVKQRYANSPTTYEGYGSRLGVEKGAVLDWSDYYYLHYLPCNLRDLKKWPGLPSGIREVTAEYSKEIVRLGTVLLGLFSINLGLNRDYLQTAFGGDDIGACLRVNFYPKCPQPDLTLGLSSHSDPGGMTFLLPDPHVPGLQVRRHDEWITVKPAPHAFIVNIGDQLQVALGSGCGKFRSARIHPRGWRGSRFEFSEPQLSWALCGTGCFGIAHTAAQGYNQILSNAVYKSVEHRVLVNSSKERISLAYFYNPRSDLLIQPASQLVTSDKPALYPPRTFDEYRLYIRTNGPKGKSQIAEASSREYGTNLTV